MGEKGSLLDGILQVGGGGGGDEKRLIDMLFSDNWNMLKKTGELQPDMVGSTSVLGLVAGRFKSKILMGYDKEVLSRSIAKDRKGRLELVETMRSIRLPGEGEPD